MEEDPWHSCFDLPQRLRKGSMSWLAKSLANSLIPDHAVGGESVDDEEDLRSQWRRSELKSSYSHDDRRGGGDIGEEDEDPTRGVKEDLSELTKTLTRQFWGVARFLAPPPHSSEAGSTGDRPDPASAPRDDGPESGFDTPSIAGIRSDIAEIGGRFKSEISKLSSNKAVTEISKIASTFLPFGSEEDNEEYEGEEEQGSGRRYGVANTTSVGAIGVTEEVMTFVRNISMHPETWLDFPLLSDDEESDDFDMSDAQQAHAYAVESLTPRLAALRIELCPTHMSEGCFWKIYFVLLHPRLNKHDAELLSTPQIVEARSLLQQKLQKKSETQRPTTETSYRNHDDTTNQLHEHTAVAKDLNVISPPRRQEAVASYSTDFEIVKHTVSSTEIEIVDKGVTEEEIPKQSQNLSSDALNVSMGQLDEEGNDDWLEEESGDIDALATITIPLDNDEDVSFSDLEEEDDKMPPPKSAQR